MNDLKFKKDMYVCTLTVKNFWEIDGQNNFLLTKDNMLEWSNEMQKGTFVRTKDRAL